MGRFVICTIVLSLCVQSHSNVSGEEFEDTTATVEDAKDVSKLEQIEEPEKSRGQQSTTAQVPIDGYYSPNLRASFLVDDFSVRVNGRWMVFTGARLTGTNPGSPLNGTSIRLGDVVSRLDGIPIGRGKYQSQQGSWQAPQLERHYGRTVIRFVRSGTHEILNETINLGPLNQGGGGILVP